MSADSIIVLAVASAFALYLGALTWVFFFTRAWTGPQMSRAAVKRRRPVAKSLAAAE